MRDFFVERETAARNMANRGPIELDSNGDIESQILEAYWEQGFYIFENVIDADEMSELRSEFHRLLECVPRDRSATTDCSGRPLRFDETERKLFRFARPLSDPYGGTDVTNSRYQVKLTEPPLPKDAPSEVLLQIGGILQFLDSALRIYGHPKLLKMSEAVNGEDFTPFNEVIRLKQPKVGAAVSWHQDGTTHWNSESLDPGTHGFNFMLNLYETNPENALWVVAGTHRNGKANIKEMMVTSESEYLDGTIPLLCKPGGVAIVNRQLVHGSFPNRSSQPRYTFVFGFHRRSSVEGVQGWASEPYNDTYIRDSSHIISLAIAARTEKYPEERPFEYKSECQTQTISWDEFHREAILKHYHRRAIGI